MVIVPFYGFSYFSVMSASFLSVLFLFVQFLKLECDTFWSYYEGIYSSISVASMFLLSVKSV